MILELDDLRGTWTLRSLTGRPMDVPEDAVRLVSSRLLPAVREAMMSRCRGGLVRSAAVRFRLDPFLRPLPSAVGVMEWTDPHDAWVHSRVTVTARVDGHLVRCDVLREGRRPVVGGGSAHMTGWTRVTSSSRSVPIGLPLEDDMSSPTGGGLTPPTGECPSSDTYDEGGTHD